jgi:hypothetical protein
MTTWIRATGILLVLSAVTVITPGNVAAQPPLPESGAVLYELTENLNLRALKAGQRKATSQLMGIAKGGTPLCPASLGVDYCTINATGSDNINVQTGMGNFGGTFTVVAQGDNPTDSPEAVLARGHFSGKMDFSPALVNGIPLGTVTGEVGLTGSKSVPFAGTFRLPVGYAGYSFYLGAQGWDWVRPNEEALGYPAVKFEISFPASN